MPPQRPDTGNDLLLDLVREYMAERARDQADGLSLRSLDRILTEHIATDDARHRELASQIRSDIEQRLREVEHHVARSDGMETGRFRFVDSERIPLQAPVTVNVNGTNSGNGRKTSHSVPFLTRAFASPRGIAFIISGISVVCHLILHLLHL